MVECSPTTQKNKPILSMPHKSKHTKCIEKYQDTITAKGVLVANCIIF